MFVPWYVPKFLHERYQMMLFKAQWAMENQPWIRKRVPQAQYSYEVKREMTGFVTKVVMNEETVTFH